LELALVAFSKGKSPPICRFSNPRKSSSSSASPVPLQGGADDLIE
jgi:hypothetical protein